MSGANNVPILGCEQRRTSGRSALNPMLITETENDATLAWLEVALEHAYAHGQRFALAYLEAVMEDAVFEEEMAARTASVLG
jgi:hypothetical protein